MRQAIRRYRERLGDDRRFVSGRYSVTLTRYMRPWRSEVKVWKDVRPALGGLISRKVTNDAEAERIYDEAVTELIASRSGEQPGSHTTPRERREPGTND